tara:strand:- start:1166 stop:2071 length:906 start_codon:yes stop_codon:yes gene_type:complete
MGPTGIGKTDLAFKLYDSSDIEIISVDSVQVYKHLNIGSGKPDKEVLNKYPHKLIDIIEPYDSYSTGKFQTDCIKEIKKINLSNKTPLLVGGTMLYFKNLFNGLSELPESTEEIREEVELDCIQKGLEAMHDYLKEIDPVSAKSIHPNDTQRIKRAIEVYRLTNKPLSLWHKESLVGMNKDLKPFDIHQFAIRPKDKKIHRNNVAIRFQDMIDKGLIKEVEDLLNKNQMDTAKSSMRSVGYKQVSEYLEGNLSFDEMISKAVTATRQLAKRQMTWLRSWNRIIWLEEESGNNLDIVLGTIN